MLNFGGVRDVCFFVGVHFVHQLCSQYGPPEGHDSLQSCLGGAEHPSLCGLGFLKLRSWNLEANNFWVVLWNIFFMFIPTWGRFPFWLNFFQLGWNHQLDFISIYFPYHPCKGTVPETNSSPGDWIGHSKRKRSHSNHPFSGGRYNGLFGVGSRNNSTCWWSLSWRFKSLCGKSPSQDAGVTARKKLRV